MRVGPTCPRGASSGVVPPSPSSTSAYAAETFGAIAPDADVPPSTTSDDLNIRRTLDHVLTVQAAHGQILVDMLDEICALRVELAQFRRSPHHLPLDDGFCLPFGIPLQKGGVHCRVFVFRGRVYFYWLDVTIKNGEHPRRFLIEMRSAQST